MSDRTLTALYETRQDAEAARARLHEAGFDDNVDIHDQTGSDRGGPHAAGGFMESVREFFGGHPDRHAYDEGLRRGHYLLTVRVDELEAERVAELLDATSAVDLDNAEETWRGDGWTAPIPMGETAPVGDATPLGDAAPGAMAAGARAAGEEEVIPIVEERLRVGKREVGRGGVKVRSYVVETPVHDQIGLREEHVSVERRSVDRPATDADAAFRDREIELTETAEEAVVVKDTVVREELVVRKQVDERVENVDANVRRTEVEVEDTTGRTPAMADKPI